MQDIDQASLYPQLERLIALLNEALALVDDMADRPDVGARLQHIVETLQEESA